MRGPGWIRPLALLLLLLAAVPGRAAPLDFNEQPERLLPPVIQDSQKPKDCTIVYLVADTLMNDLYAMRMQVTPQTDAVPVAGRMPCPDPVPPRVAARAMESCKTRASHPNQCVFADMARGFAEEPEERNTSEIASRCASDRYGFIGVACWNANGRDVCNVACGATAQEARTEARERCQLKHQQICDIIGSLPIQLP